MLSQETIEKDIIELEARDTTYTNLQRLAPLYLARLYDMFKNEQIPTPTAIETNGTTELQEAVKGRNSAAVWAIMDELMAAVKVLHPKMYDKVIEKIKDI